MRYTSDGAVLGAKKITPPVTWSALVTLRRTDRELLTEYASGGPVGNR
jgi:hypothetical protein